MDSGPDALARARAELMAHQGNAVTVPALRVAMASERPPVPFIGAAFREMSGLPEWSAFLRELAANIGVTSTSSDDDSWVANIIAQAGPLFLDDSVDDAYGERRLRARLADALAMIPHLVRDVIVTTSISRELELAFSRAGARSILIHDLSSAHEVRLDPPEGQATRPIVLKVRGDIADHGSRTLTWAAYARSLDATPAFPAFAQALADSGRAALFIGMALRGAPLAEVLLKDAERMPPSYAVLDVGLQRGDFIGWLYSRRIRPIWYQPDTGQLEALLVDLADALCEPAMPKPGRWPVRLFFPETALPVPAPALVPEFVQAIAPPPAADPVPARELAPPPEPPAGLVESINAGECVAFVGSGLSARAGLPTWRGFVAGLVEEATALAFMSADEASHQRAALEEGEINAVADNAISAFDDERDLLLDYYRRASTASAGASPPRSIALLGRIPFAGMLTSNYDKSLLRALREPVADTLTPRDGEKLLEALSARERPFLVQLYGDLDRPDTIVTAPADYQNLVRTNAAFSRFIEGVFFSRTILFLGTSLEGLTDFLAGFRFPSGVPRPHYALIAVRGQRWQAMAQTLKRRYNIEVLAYPESPAHAEFDAFLGRLHDKVSHLGPAGPDTSVQPGEPQLLRIELRNIGPFAALDIDVARLRMILLGDNGVGKSTILKAIAIAIVGSEGRHYASRLLRSGESSGSVRIVTRRNPNGYLAEIQRVGAEAEVISRSGRLLETEGWVAIAFPPLRTTSWKPTKGPQGLGTRRPTAEDLLPILGGDVDARMDDLKQWLVNTDSARRDEKAAPADRARAERILATFFSAVGTLTEGLAVGFEEITTDYRVLVRTPDGVVPIESLSQGMTSLLSWIGIVVQRLHEIGDAADPMLGQALILMDEIDAHMHPAWQQRLLPRLRQLLPNVQIIASTHSPLVVAGLDVDEIVRFDRDASGKVVRKEIERDMTIGRADQILTGDLFSLDSTLALGEDGEAMQAEYERLLAKSQRSAAEEERHAELGRKLVERIPPAGAENKLERRSQELVRAVLTADYRPDGVEDLGRMLAGKANAVLASMGWSGSAAPAHDDDARAGRLDGGARR